MNDHKSLLIELGTDELPPGALDKLSKAFAEGVCAALRKRGIAADFGAARAYATPRRLAVLVPEVGDRQPDQANERLGPAVSAGLDADGKPTGALQGFARSCGVSVAELTQVETDKGPRFAHNSVAPGRSLAELAGDILAEAIESLPIPKPMRWGDHDYRFARPAHWLVVLHGDQVLPATALGLESSRQSRGHRFHHAEPVSIADADSWLESLRAAWVLADPVERRERVVAELQRVGYELDDGNEVEVDPANLAEVINLTEWPVALACGFESDFLDVPAEVLVLTMQVNQKFFPVHDASGKLAARFVGIANIESKDPAEIRKGYERVIRPRFADAKFFWDEDRKQPLEAYHKTLESVTYQKDLGSVWDKTCRVAELARTIAGRVGVDGALATRAASLAKCDLMTRMVGEFPELQGVMGRYYAAGHGESAEVAQALDEFYMPRQSGDRIATGRLAQVLAVAERVDTLAGIFAVGQQPSGNKDPFALRRAALGLARSLIEADLRLDLWALFLEALERVPDTAFAAGAKRRKQDGALDVAAARRDTHAALHDFVLDRLRGYYVGQGFDGSLFEAVAAVDPSDLGDFDARLRALAAFVDRPESARLAAANKRVANILRKQAEAGHRPAAQVDAEALCEPAGQALAAALEAVGGDVEAALAAADYARALDLLTELDQPLADFFDQVMVAADDPHLRANRLALLARIHGRFRQIADIACCADLGETG